jgi:diguanylate cyclase (GGDEF)-like protein
MGVCRRRLLPSAGKVYSLKVETNHREKTVDNLKRQPQKTSDYLETQSKLFFITIGLILVILVGIVDYVTGYEITFSIFYLIPVAMVSWYVGRPYGILISFASAITWFLADTMTGHTYSQPFITYWNTSVSLGFFLVVAFSLSQLRAELKRERKLAQTDFLTGIANSGYFTELLTWEINRCRRYMNPLTLAYIGCDNFKAVNDQFGHHAGNHLLCLVADTIKSTIRITDMVARLGGDEFVILFPETGADQANLVIHKIQNDLLHAVRKDGWKITFSMGVVTYMKSANTSDEVIGMADRLMYDAKSAGKNMIRHEIFEADSNPTRRISNLK